MQLDFHYYATYCAAFLAGYSHEEALTIGYSSQFTDCCSETLLRKLHAPLSASTTQLQPELLNEDDGIVGHQKITRIWASFHFLPRDLYASYPKRSRSYLNRYRLICGPNGDLLVKTVQLAKGKPLQAVGIAMHILADTWAHTYFAGTPSNVINNTTSHFYELLDRDGVETERKVSFIHNPLVKDNPEKGTYTNSIQQENETSIMNLGHGRAGHFPDYGYARYRYLPAWKNYEEILKDNPSDYYSAFTQMVYALQYLRGARDTFEKDTYAADTAAPYETEIRAIITTRKTQMTAEWKAFAEKLSGHGIEDFDIEKYQQEYMDTPKEARDDTFLGRYFLAAMHQKSMVTHEIFQSGNLLAGFSVDFNKKGFAGILDFKKLTETLKGGSQNG